MMVPRFEEGFRLGDAVSECSMRSKARIDALFEDATSVRSATCPIGNWCVASSLDRYSLNVLEDDSSEEQTRANGAVQARIEAMFASVEAETGTLGKSASAILPVKYMGAAAVGGRVACVRGLQEPLRQLLERAESARTAELEISRRGLTFRITDTASERTNPFRRIAVWSALRLRSRSLPGHGEPMHAFLPLLGDERGPGTENDLEERHVDLYRVMRGLKRDAEDYPPVFAVVMRRPGAARVLECHGFACSSEEDAVAAAATLHRALLADLDSNRRRPRQANGLGRASLASVASSFGQVSVLGRNSRIGAASSAGEQILYPVRPPRVKKTERGSARRPKISEIKAEDVLEARSRQFSATKNVTEQLRENKLLREKGEEDMRVSPVQLVRDREKTYTTVTPPVAWNDYEKLRKKAIYSFVEPRVETRYPLSVRALDGAVYAEGRRREGGELEMMDRPARLNRCRTPGTVRLEGDEDAPKIRKRTRAGSEPPRVKTEQQALERHRRRDAELKRSRSDLEVDRGDPMTRVELPRRGSFLKAGSARLPKNANGGTPLGFTELFDEFRNQEGLTSVDDILATIIDPEGMSFNDLKPLYKEFLLKLAATLTQDELYERSASIMRRRGRSQRRRSTRKPCLLGRAIRRSVFRFKGRPTEFTSVMVPARKLDDSFDGSSSCEARNERRKILTGQFSRRRASWKKTRPALAQTTSEDSDTCRRVGRNGANRSSSGYVSCSECSYDSESCTCVSADKCYCSLSRRVPTAPTSGERLVCACDTDSCSDGNKCYCACGSSQPTILEQLRQRGIVPSESTLSRAGSTDGAKTSRTDRSHASSKSLEFLKIRRSPGRGSSDNFGLDYDLFSPGKKSRCGSNGSERVLVVSAHDPRGRLVYMGGSEREDASGFENRSNRDEANREALSIKKSAEIAAIFGPDSVRSRPRARASVSSARSSVSLEAGLGYLP